MQVESDIAKGRLSKLSNREIEVLRLIPVRESGSMDITDVEKYLRELETHNINKKQSSIWRIILISVITSIVTTIITILLTKYLL